jgi:hypothetical protein
MTFKTMILCHDGSVIETKATIDARLGLLIGGDVPAASLALGRVYVYRLGSWAEITE